MAVGCSDPIDLEDGSGGTSSADTGDTDTRPPDPSGPRPSTSGGNATSGAWTTGWDDTGWYTSVGGGYTDSWSTDGGWSTFGDSWGDDWGTWGLGPCWMFDEAGCLDAAAQGFNCAWLPQYHLDSDVSCTWELEGYACLDLGSPPAPGCVAPSSCANGAGTFQVGGPFEALVPYSGCAQLVDHDSCVPGSPSPKCACACINPPPP